MKVAIEALMTAYCYCIIIIHAITVATGVVIGFLNTSYHVNETDGLVDIQIGIIEQGILRSSVTVSFSISQNQSDKGKLKV